MRQHAEMARDPDKLPQMLRLKLESSAAALILVPDNRTEVSTLPHSIALAVRFPG